MNEPLTGPMDAFFMKAFNDLSTCRFIGMDVGPIPWKDVLLYARMEGLDEESTEVFMTVLREMDGAYMDWRNKESERERQMNKSEAKNTRGRLQHSHNRRPKGR